MAMRLVHQINLRAEAKHVKQFASAGFQIEIGIQAIKVYDDDQRWPALKAIVRNLDASVYSGTEFDDVDRASSSYLKMATAPRGYPQPEKAYAYLRKTFDDANGCPGGDLERFAGGVIQGCGVNYRQKAPFRIRKVPNLDRLKIFGINWVHEVVFVRRDVYESVFKPRGIGFWPVIQHSTNLEIDNLVQLRIDIEVDVDVQGLSFEECQFCGTRKYMANRIGPYPAPEPTDAAMFMSRQYFGIGFAANRHVMVSNELYREITELKLKGASFVPCAEPGY